MDITKLQNRLGDYYRMKDKEKIKYLKDVIKTFQNGKTQIQLPHDVEDNSVELLLSKDKILDASTLAEYSAVSAYEGGDIERMFNLYFRAIDINISNVRPLNLGEAIFGTYLRRGVKAQNISNFILQIIEKYPSKIKDYEGLKNKAKKKNWEAAGKIATIGASMF